MIRLIRALILTTLLASSHAASAAAIPVPAAGPTRVDILAAEAARAATPAQLQVLRDGLRSRSSEIQRMAVRALGRLERAALVDDILPLLAAGSGEVRAEAANALAQSLPAVDVGRVRAARTALLQQLQREKDPMAIGELCAALGRLPYDNAADVQAVEQVLASQTARTVMARTRTVEPASPLVGVRIGWSEKAPHHTLGTIGALRGLEALIRTKSKLSRPTEETRARLHAASGSREVMVRRLAMLVLNLAGGPDAATLNRAATDQDEQVRRLAAAAPTATRASVEAALRDASGMVRYEALRVYGRRFLAEAGCAPVVNATRDTSATVALLALDLLGGTCRAEDGALDALDAAVTGTHARWQRPAHALVALAKVGPERARTILANVVAGEPWQARMYAARAAAALGDEPALRALAADRSSNVREAAMVGLVRLVKHAADPLYLQALTSDDPQLVMTAARALEGTKDTSAVAALAGALTRLTAADSDNTRDPRLALLDRLAELGSAAAAPTLRPLLNDADPRIAARAADVMSTWTGSPHVASPRLRPIPAVPSQDRLDRLRRTTVKVVMEGGAAFDIRLLDDLAPLACARFVDLAAAGYYNGLTFHRIVPNFVIQGGSPGANEFWGDSRFMVDEVGRVMQARGTIGLSTRGRDTGDAQFYVNLVDLPRLDHEYTVFAEVAEGMNVVDDILEGDRIVSITLHVKGGRGSR